MKSTNISRRSKGMKTVYNKIFYNLIGNAIKFTESGTITLSARVVSEPAELPRDDVETQTLTFPLVAISVTDTGIGIPQEKRVAIFQSFEQIDGSSTRKYGGTGLGLAVTKQLVELHDGVIWVDSTPGQGSTFTFTLPISDELPARIETIVPLPEPFDHAFLARKALKGARLCRK